MLKIEDSLRLRQRERVRDKECVSECSCVKERQREGPVHGGVKSQATRVKNSFKTRKASSIYFCGFVRRSVKSSLARFSHKNDSICSSLKRSRLATKSFER